MSEINVITSTPEIYYL